MDSTSAHRGEIDKVYHGLDSPFKEFSLENQTTNSTVDPVPSIRERSHRLHSAKVKSTKAAKGTQVIDLPHDILFEFIKLLSTIDILVLSQACRTFRHVILTVSHPSIAHITTAWSAGTSPTNLMCRNEIRDFFLSRVMRDNMGSIMCPTCSKIHTVDLTDIPSKRHKQEWDYRDTDCVLFHGFFQRGGEFAYTHVHFLLKYFRHWNTIGAARQRYAREIMAPYSRATGKVACTVYPKVLIRRCLAADWYEMRVLTNTVRVVKKGESLKDRHENENICPIGLSPCSHDRLVVRDDKNTSDLKYSGVATMITHIRDPESKGVEYFGACDLCSTDFSWKKDKDGTFTLTTWQDLGGDHWLPERLEAYKRPFVRWAQPRLNDDTFWEAKPQPVWSFKRPGSVIEAYEETEGYAPWYETEMKPRDSETLGELMFLPPAEIAVHDWLRRSCEGVLFDGSPHKPAPNTQPRYSKHCQHCQFCRKSWGVR